MHFLSEALLISSKEKPRRAHTLCIDENDALYQSQTATSLTRLGF